MAILNTSSLTARVKRGVEIRENVTSIALIEYPPLKSYEKFHGQIYQRRWRTRCSLQASKRDSGGCWGGEVAPRRPLESLGR